MEEREQLRRQIRLLQGLINNHKNVHGNAPVPPPTQWRNPRPSAFSSQGAFSARYAQQTQRDFLPRQSSPNSWRKKYSLVNVPPRPTLCSGSSVSANASWNSESHASSEATEPQTVFPGRSTGFKAGGNVVVGVQAGSAAGSAAVLGSQQSSSEASEGPAVSRGCVSSTAWPLDVGSKRNKGRCVSTMPRSASCKAFARVGDCVPAVCRKGLALQGVSELGPDLCRTISETAVSLKSEPQQQPLTLPDRKSSGPSGTKSPALQVPALRSSQYTSAATDKPSPLRTAGKFVAHSTWEAPSAVGVSLSKDKHSVPALQRAPTLPASIRSPRFRKTNYTWVANPSKSPRAVKRLATSRASESVRKTAVGAERGPKLLPRGDLGSKQKKSNVPSKLGISSSQYKWKASGPQPSPSTSTSAFTWQRKEGDWAGVSPFMGASTSLQTVRHGPLGHGNPRPSSGNTSFFSYKLKSWTKIIKRRGNACSPADKRSASFPTVLLKSRYSLRKRNCSRGRSSPTARRAGSKGLVHISKHRLRRLPASRVHLLAKEGSSFLVSNPTANKVVNTRYRIVKKTVTSPSSCAASFSSPVHGWKSRRVSTSRSLVLNCPCHSSPGSKSQALQHRWRNKGLRCIGGVMYRVSANKLAKTSTSPAKSGEVASRGHGRAARLDSAYSTPGYSPSGCPSRSTTSRYIASRAVQRSLAIIRQAKQKKEKKKKKEYCMYYNRFGKCNRGERCPYIHDPEKVAVCTRFLRGTCKKTDGTCPFSHKVSKDKMPVCSYFLKGICNNSDCPYSHVYVSRKAEVCSDFLKGYCPLGEKCKKKHTLVCLDFSKHGVCPKGSQCKLLHPQRKRLARQPNATDSVQPVYSAPKLGRPADQTSRKEDNEETAGPSGSERERTVWNPEIPLQTSKLTKLPSFISLRSPSTSPSEEDRKPERDRSGEDAGRPLQIKPRL
ncbi:zinc finger CCCH domain-containing protein 3 [Rhineura floridana]|uniref:zinc finger CCCH domain-containing protein 3 n=1 Tax=Rhineura floridana TaxID=261503 RepID=UPI002AC88A8A|nr:zinc finger CCCH domain-containing protein 3 [Rhineura floridana]